MLDWTTSEHVLAALRYDSSSTPRLDQTLAYPLYLAARDDEITYGTGRCARSFSPSKVSGCLYVQSDADMLRLSMSVWTGV